MTTKQIRIDDEPETVNAKATRKLLPQHEQIARDEKRLEEKKARLVQSLLQDESGIADDLKDLLKDCDAARSEQASEIAMRVTKAIACLDGA